MPAPAQSKSTARVSSSTSCREFDAHVLHQQHCCTGLARLSVCCDHTFLGWLMVHLYPGLAGGLYSCVASQAGKVRTASRESRPKRRISHEAILKGYLNVALVRSRPSRWPV